MRIDKLLSNLKYGSRKEIKKSLKSGHIFVNQHPVKVPIVVDPVNDVIEYCGERIFYQEDLIIVMNKPNNILSANSDSKHKTVIELLPDPYWRFDLKIAGRLDIDTTGLLVLTTNGELVHTLTSPNHQVEKEYLVGLLSPLRDSSKLIEGVYIKDGQGAEFIAKAKCVEVIDDRLIKMVLTEGKFHQVKKMIEAVNNEVISLKRIRIGKYHLADLAVGKIKVIERDEII